MILFDEVQICNIKRVNSKKMTYVGLTDNRNSSESTEHADNVLVFMFYPVGD